MGPSADGRRARVSFIAIARVFVSCISDAWVVQTCSMERGMCSSRVAARVCKGCAEGYCGFMRKMVKTWVA